MSDVAATTIIPAPIHPLKALRRARKLSQVGAACAIKCSPNILIYTERYNYRPTVELQQRIASFFEVDRKVIWPGEDD